MKSRDMMSVLRHESPDKVKCALADTKHLQEIADSGYECCKGRHSWIERAVVIGKYFC